MEMSERILILFEDGVFCDCKQDYHWERLVDDNNRFAGYELQHRYHCIGRIKAAELLKEIKDEQV